MSGNNDNPMETLTETSENATAFIDVNCSVLNLLANTITESKTQLNVV